MNYCNFKKKCLSSLSMQSAQRNFMCCANSSFLPHYLRSCRLTVECDQTSILHNNIKLIWGHLGYANEGQRSNLPCFVSQEPLVQLSSNFVCIWSVTRQAYYIKTLSWYEAILVMQMKVKGQISFSFVSQKPLVESSPNFVCICYVISQSYYIITPSWHEAILAMQMKVKGQTPLCIVFEQPLVQSSPNFACICSVINQSYYIITTSWHEAILAMQMKVKGQISWILCLRYLKNRMSNHLQIFTVSLPWWRMDTLIFSAWSPNHDVI